MDITLAEDGEIAVLDIWRLWITAATQVVQVVVLFDQRVLPNLLKPNTVLGVDLQNSVN